MEWPKLKNVILLILLITNLFLLALMGVRSWNASQYESAARSDTLEILARNGISMEETALPKDVLLSTASVSRDRAGEAEMLTELLGPVTEETLGGGQFTYTGALGQAQLRSRGEFSISLQPGSYPLSGKPEAHAADTLKKIGFEGTVLSSTSDSRGNAEVTFLQEWEGSPVLSCQVTVVYKNVDMVSISGTCLPGAPTAGSRVRLSAVNDVLHFLEQIMASGDVCTQITAMQAGYRLSAGPSDPLPLTPVWYFQTDSGSYILNPATMELNRL